MKRGAAIALVISAAVGLAYLPVFNAGFVWDDDDWLTENPLVHQPGRFADIWTGAERLQYYPLLFSTFRAEHALWGYEPLGYHLVNVLLHAINAVLLGLILARLEIRGAWWVAALFALHPIQVESVAWVTELKNVLSGCCYLAALLAFLQFLRSGRSWPYAAALLAFIAAMLTKTATATLPAALLLLVLWTSRRLERRHLWMLAPFFAIGTVLAGIAVSLETGLVDAVQADFAFSAGDRLLLAARATVFYPLKILLPFPLIFNYPRWEPGGVAAIGALLVVVVVAAASIVLWIRGRRGLGCALGFYAVTLSPALGFFDVYAFRYAFVADHFQYLAGIGVMILVVQAVLRVGRYAPAVLGVIVLLCASLTFNQARAYHDERTLWLDTLAKNPDSWIAQHNLALSYLDAGELDDALRHLNEAIRVKPASAESHVGRGMAHARRGEAAAALDDFDRAVELNPRYPQARLQRGELRVRSGLFREALDDLDLFLSANPDYLPALGLRARARVELREYESALVDLDRALALGAGVQGHIDRGTVQMRLGRQDAACVDWREACRLGDCALLTRYCSGG